MPIIFTPRLELLPATVELLRTELKGVAALSEALGLQVPSSWPPEFYDADAIDYTLKWLAADPGQADWGFYYVAQRLAMGGTLVGAGGFKGLPDQNGVVEIGYSICPEFQKKDYATEAVERWLNFAFSSGQVMKVVAQTLPSLVPSIRVLEKAGFQFVGSGSDPQAPAGSEVVLYEIARKL